MFIYAKCIFLSSIYFMAIIDGSGLLIDFPFDAIQDDLNAVIKFCVFYRLWSLMLWWIQPCMHLVMYIAVM